MLKYYSGFLGKSYFSIPKIHYRLVDKRRVYVVNYRSLVIITIFVLLILQSIPSHTANTVYNKVFIVYAPGFDYVKAVNYIQNNTVIANSTIVKLYPQPLYTQLFYQLMILSGGSYSLGNGIPLDHRILSWDGSLVDPVEIVDQELINKTWGSKETVFVYVDGVSPINHTRTINPYYRYEEKAIPPSVFKIRLGERIYWDLLGTYLRVYREGNNYVLDIEGYVKENFSATTLTTRLIELNVSGDVAKVNGIFRIVFKLFELGDDKVLLVTPGSYAFGEGLSKYYEDYDKALVLSFIIEPSDASIVSEKTEAIQWLLNYTLNSYEDVIKYVFKRAIRAITFINYPFFSEIQVLRKYVSREDFEDLERLVYENFARILDLIHKKYSRGVAIEIVSPYTYIQPDRELEINAQIIAPGIVEYREDVVEELSKNNITYQIINVNNKNYILYIPLKTSINDFPAIYYGYKLVYPRTYDRTVLLPSLAIVGELAVLSRATPYNVLDYIIEVRKLEDEVVELNATARDLNASIRNLLDEIDRLKLYIGNINSTKVELEEEIRNLTSQLKRLEEEKEQIMIYLTTGIASIIVLAVILVVIIRKSFK